MRLFSLLLLILPLACVAEVDDFVETAARVSCKRQRECNMVRFEEQYSDLRGCENARGDELQEIADNAIEAGCEYVRKEARKCVRKARYKKKDCGLDNDSAVRNACAGVFDCGGESRIDIVL